MPTLTARQKLVLVLFVGTFLLMIYGFIPWNDLWQEGFGKNFPLPTFSDFYFPEAAGLFLVMAVVIGLIAKLGEEGTVTTIVAGAADFLGAALIIVFARGITVVMKNSYMTDTILHWMENAVSGSSAGVFAISAFIVNMPIAFLVPSSSGHAALVMPILAPLADFAGVSRALVVTAFQSASGFVNLVTPTSAVIMGGLALSKVGYDRYLKFVWPFLARLRRRLRVHRHRGGDRLMRLARLSLVKGASPMTTATATTLGTNSEVGTLRTVIVHRPDLAHERLSPTNCHELLFDDVIWVRRARQEHDAFVDLMRERGVEVLLFHELLAETLEQADAREWVLSRRLRPEEVTVDVRRRPHGVDDRDAGRRARDAADRRRHGPGAPRLRRSRW